MNLVVQLPLKLEILSKGPGIEEDSVVVLESVVAYPEKEGLSFGDNGNVVNGMADLHIPSHSLLLLGVLHEGDEFAEKVNLRYHCHKYFDRHA